MQLSNTAYRTNNFQLLCNHFEEGQVTKTLFRSLLRPVFFFNSKQPVSIPDGHGKNFETLRIQFAFFHFPSPFSFFFLPFVLCFFFNDKINCKECLDILISRRVASGNKALKRSGICQRLAKLLSREFFWITATC